MPLDHDTFLTTVYCLIDDLYQTLAAPSLAHKPGAKGKLSDSEVLTLAALAQWQAHRCERCFLRFARHHWQAYFPILTSQSAFNRRVRTLWPVLALLGPALAEQLPLPPAEPPTAEEPAPAVPAYDVWDGVPIPLMRRCRARRQQQFGLEAGVARGGVDREWYYGLHALVVVRADGPITGFVLGDRRPPRSTGWPKRCCAGGTIRPRRPRPRRSWRWCWGAGQPSGRPCISDLGCRGKTWRRHWQQTYGATVLTKADYAEVSDQAAQRAWKGWLCRLRQRVETTFNTLTDTLGAKFPRVRGLWGLWTRFAAKVLAFNLLVAVNHRFGRGTFEVFNPLS